MGWIQRNEQAQSSESLILEGESRRGALASSAKSDSPQTYRFAPMDISDDDLPFIPFQLISSKSKPGRLAIKGQTAADPSRRDWWIVVDNIVYDCTDFILEHPGGEQVIMSFIGEDCSWQFRRFHSQRIIQEVARPLRVGRTAGAQNRFKEPKKRSGPSSFATDEW